MYSYRNNTTLPSMAVPLKRTFCSNRRFCNISEEVKFISLETALHFSIFFGTLATNKKQRNFIQLVAVVLRANLHSYLKK